MAACASCASPASSRNVDGSAAPLPACPDPSLDSDAGAALGDAAFVMWSVDATASAPGDPSLEPVSLDAAPMFAVLYPAPGVAASTTGPGFVPDNVLVRPMSPEYALDVYPPAEMRVTLPLANAYAGCQAALYYWTSSATPVERWHRAAGFSGRSVSGVVTLQATAMPGTLLVAGTCGTECDSDCVDLATDDSNCGACGNACGLQSFCVQGACGGLVLGASASDLVDLVALDADSVYFLTWTPKPSGPPDHYSIASYPKAGGPMTVVVPDLQSNPIELRAAGGSLYWLLGSVWSQAIPNGAAAPVGGAAAASLGACYSFAVDGVDVYYGICTPAGGPGVVASLPVGAQSTDAQTTIASTATGPMSLDTDGKHLVWFDGDAVWALDIMTSGSAPVALAATSGAPPPQVVRVDGDFAYVATGPKVGLGPGTIQALPLDGSPGQVLAQPNELVDMAAFGSAIAWTDLYSVGSVWAKIPGRAPVVLARGIAGKVAMDADAVYVVGGVKVWRVSLPK